MKRRRESEESVEMLCWEGKGLENPEINSENDVV